MVFRILTGAGLLLLGYYVGREIGKAESIRSELKETPDDQKPKNVTAHNSADKPKTKKKRVKKPIEK